MQARKAKAKERHLEEQQRKQEEECTFKPTLISKKKQSKEVTVNGL